jgi:outer membrane lipoprotein SlyB
MKKNYAMTATALIAATFFGGCASPNYQSSQSSYPGTTQSAYATYGTVDSIQVINTSGGSGGIGAGAVVGGVVGGALGNQVGSGRGRTAATVAGAAGGAILGHQIEQRNRPVNSSYQVGVRLDNGSYQTVVQDSVADLSIGSRVRIENGRAYRY